MKTRRLQGRLAPEQGAAPSLRQDATLGGRESFMATLLGATPLIGLHAVAVDSETTGLDVRKARMIEFAALPIEHGELDREAAWSTLIACGEPVPPASQAVHGISDADLSGQPDFPAVAPKMAALLRDKVMIGHTIGFDLALLEHEHRRAGLTFQRPVALDVRHLAQIVAPNLPGYSLEALAAWLGVTPRDRHRAMGDAEAAGLIFIGLIPKLREAGFRTVGETLLAVKRLTDGPAGAAPAEWDINDANAAALRAGPSAVGIKLDGYPYRHRVRDLMTRGPLTLPPATTIRDALALMVEKRISSVLVSDMHGETARTGILTERDMMRALAEQGAGALDLPIGKRATTPLITVPDEALLYRAIGRMTNRNLRHLVATGPAGDITGIISARDLLRLRASSSIALGDDIDAAPDTPRLAKAWAKLPAMAAALIAEEVPARDVAGVVAREIGALTRRAAQLAEAATQAAGEGGPPCPYAVLVLGSAGRGESLLAMDQDNALIFGEGEPDGPEDRWFASMAARMNDILHEVGVPLCKGGVMAREPAFRGSLDTWRGRVRRWLARSNPEDMLAVDIFFDFRAVHGELLLADTLWREAWAAVHDDLAFLKLLAAGVEEGAAPLSFFGKLKSEEDGRIDLKRHGLKRLVTAARVLALRHGVPRHATHDRLSGIIERKVAGEAELQRLDQDHALVLDAILRQQLADIAEGKSPGNRIAVKPLPREQVEALTAALSRQADIAELLRAQLSGQLPTPL
jgi:DNA polymerase-3 subunit epsilon/CBS domain-containing protein